LGIANRLKARLLTEIRVTCWFVYPLVQVLNRDALAETLVTYPTLLLITVTKFNEACVSAGEGVAVQICLAFLFNILLLYIDCPSPLTLQPDI
jgi:hypothetical protein